MGVLYFVQNVNKGGKKIAKLCLKVGHPDIRFCGFKIENMIASVRFFSV